MKKLPICFLALLIFLVACTPYMYGVPQDTWDRMSEPERIQAMQVYEREQQARRQAAEKRAQRQAIEDQARRKTAEERAQHEAQERERAQARHAAMERERHERIEAIHRGQGAHGELIRVRLQGGKIRIGEHYHRYEPLTFTIADGETMKFGVADSHGREVDLTATYANGAFLLEGGRFPYDRSWGRGRLYAAPASQGHMSCGMLMFLSRFAIALPVLSGSTNVLSSPGIMSRLCVPPHRLQQNVPREAWKSYSSRVRLECGAKNRGWIKFRSAWQMAKAGSLQ